MSKKLEKLRNKLTFKQRKFVEVYIQTGNATESAMQAYDIKDRNSAAVIGFENLRKLNIAEFLEESGVTDKRLADKINEGLDAKKRVRDYETGEISYDPDYMAQHKFLTTALDLKGRTKQPQQQVIGEQNNIQVIIEDYKEDEEK